MKSLTQEELVSSIFRLLEPELKFGDASQFAANLGIKQPTFSSYRIGRRTPSLAVCAQLAAAVGYEVFLGLWPKGSKTALEADMALKWDRLPEARRAALSDLVGRSNDLTDQQFAALQAVWSAFLDSTSTAR